MTVKNYNHALMIVRNPKSYTLTEVREAAAYVLGTLHAQPEHCEDAGNALLSR